MPRFVLLQGGEVIPFPVTNDVMLLGRHPDCDIQLQSNMLSRKHARLVREDGSFFIEDLGSGNGTFLNGKRIESRLPINHNDRVKLGPLLLRFEGEEVAQQAPDAAATPSEKPEIMATVEIAADEDDGPPTIMGEAAGAGGYGVLEVRPEAKLKAVLEISRSLADTVEVEALLPRILDTLFGIFPHADRGCVMLKDEETGNMIPRAMKHRREDEDATVKLSRTIVNKVLGEKQGILSADATSDDQFQASESIANLSIRSMMCVPLLNLEGEPTGLINIDTLNPLQQFKPEDLELLLAVAGQAALSFESARLLVSYMEKQKQDSEMEIARGVQRALLPEKLPEADGWDFYASYESAQAVGGDYYDAMRLASGKICLSFGDVAGKGVPGALIMSRIASCVQNTMSFIEDVEEAFTAINHHMCTSMVEGRFVTYLLAVIDLETNEMTLANGGHMSPMVRRPDGSIEEFDEETIGLPIGVMEGYPYEVVKRVIEPGDTVVFFTDGVDEAMAPDGTLYTLERMREFIANSSSKSDELGRALLADVRAHANGRAQNDDITIMTFGRHPE
jgi:serine phosphatase RsbU (regulator of sigma subunit)